MSEGIVQGYRISPQQRRLWLLHQAAHGGVFWSRCVVRVVGAVDLKKLEQAICRVIDEHEILRTTFPVFPGMTLPVQVVHEQSPACVKRLDPSLDNNTTADFPANYDSLPLFRCDLVELSPEQTTMILTAPAMCADVRSLENIVKQIAACFEAGETITFGSMQYADFAEWHHELLESAEAEKGKQFWNSPSRQTEVTLPFENSFAEETLFQPDIHRLKLPADVLEFAVDAGERWPRFALSCWQILIQRLAGSPEVTLGIALDGRRHSELVNSVGLYRSYVALKIESAGEQLTIAELCELITKAEAEATLRQEYFTWANGDAGSPYFSTCFEERRTSPMFCAGDVSFSIERCDTTDDRFKLKLVSLVSEGKPSLELHYDASRFAPKDVGLVAEGLATLIANASRRQGDSISELESLSDTERLRIVKSFNQTTETFPVETIHKMFEAQVQRTPDAVAVVCESDKVTYAQLNQRANQLGHYLQKQGVGPDVPVGVRLERSVDFVVAMLGILKAGGAYVPLDVNTPHARLATMLAETGVPILITRGTREMVFAGCQILSLEDMAGELANEDTHDGAHDLTPANLAYVIFTSGSMGTPKGVAVEHRQLCNYVHAIDRRMGLSSDRSFAIVSTLVADLAHTTLFTSLLSGGTLHLMTDEQSATPAALASYFSCTPIDCLKIVPSHLNALLETSDARAILPRRHLILGGEACSLSLLEKIRTLSSELTVWNHYGPTETTVGCVAQQLDSENLRSRTIPIGAPLPNNTAYVLDQRLRPVSSGVIGELYIGGDGVARGYLNRPELTAERFVPDPFGEVAGRRLYRTGDRARHLSDGRIELLGRMDHQLKVRGYRIEPEEIQLALNQHPLVIQSVVMGREDRPADKRIVAYVVTKDSTPAAMKHLREFLGQRLPEYMVPSAFVFLNALPLTPNGKIDRQALPQPRAGAGKEQFVAPRTPVETELSRIWTTVLGVEKVSIHDNFFALGGDSILGIQIIAKANQAGMNLEARQIFQHQTIAELAVVAKEGVRSDADQGIVLGDVPLSPVQKRFFELNLPDPHYYNQARLFELRQKVDPESLKRAVESLLRHHDALRLRFFRSGETWRQTEIEPDANLPFERIDISQAVDTEIGELLRSEAQRLNASLNLQEGPIMRVALFDGANKTSSYLLIVVHHLAVDTVSWGVLLEDLETAYGSFATGSEVSLPPKTTSFKAWVEHLTQFAQSSAIDQEIEYWTSRAALPATKLPVDHEGPNSIDSRRTISVSLTADETRAVLQDLPTRYRTQINEVLLTALTITFTAWTKTPSFLVDLEGHGREHIIDGVDLARTVGWFTAIFPLSLDIGNAATRFDVLRAMKDQIRAIPNRGIGYGLLRYLSGKKEVIDQLSRSPQAEVRFNYLGQLARFLSSSEIFLATHESGADTQSRRGERGYLLNVIASVTDGQLRFNWTYSENVHATETIERLAQTCLAELRALITEDETSDVAYAPSDFPKAKLSENELKAILAKLRT